MHCENCGSQLPDNSAFCSECGAKVEKQEAPPAPPTPQQGYHDSQTAPAYAPPQQSYSSPGGSSQYSEISARPLGVGSYLGMMLLTAIPIVGIIMIFVWAFGSDINPNKKNYARAILIMILISIVLAIVFGGVMAGIISMIGNALYYY